MDLKVLHLSDLHYGSKKYNEDVFESFLEDLENVGKIDFIIFSGDIVNSGREEEYEYVEEKIVDPILKKLNLSREDFYIAPGNHDMEILKSNEWVDNTLKKANKEEIYQFMSKDNFETRNLYLNKFKNFNNFKKNLNYKTAILNDMYSIHKFEKDSKKISVVCINSALLSRGEANDADYGKLVILVDLLDEINKEISDSDLKFLIQHHDFSYLIPEERNSAEVKVSKYFDFVFMGHIHSETGKTVEYNKNSTVYSKAGSLFSGRNNYNSYSFLELVGNEGTINFRTYFPDINKFNVGFNKNDGGKISFKLGHREDLLEVNLNIEQYIRERADAMLLTNFCKEGKVPKKLEDIFVTPILEYYQDEKKKMAKQFDELEIIEKEIKKESEKENNKKITITLEEIIENDKNYLIIGKKESGKTTLINYMMLKIIKENIFDKKIPIYLSAIECRKKIGRNLINHISKELNEILSYRIEYKECEKLYNKGAFVIFVDDVSLEKKDEQNMIDLNNFITEYPTIKYILLASEKYSYNEGKDDVVVNSLNNFEILKIRNFNLGQVEKLIKKWNYKNETNRKEISNVITQVKEISTLVTPYMLSLILWIKHHREVESSFINKSAILENFFDIVLDKLKSENEKYIKWDFNDKINYLAEVAEEMRRKKQLYLEKMDLNIFTSIYMKNYSLEDDENMSLVEFFEKKGIFFRYSKDKIGFKYQSYYEFFIAKLMISRSSFKKDVLNKENYFKEPEEIEYYSGLVRNDDELLKMLVTEIKELKNNLEEKNIEILEEFHLSDHTELEEITENHEENYEQNKEECSKKVNNNILQVEKIANEEFKKEEEIKIIPKIAKDFEKKYSVEEKYEIVFSLLANVIRNSSLVKNKEERKDAIRIFIKNCEWFSTLQVLMLKKKLQRTEEKIEKIIEFIFKLTISEFIKENLATPKLQLMIKEILSEEKLTAEETFLYNMLYLDLELEDSLNQVFEYVKKEKRKRILTLIKIKLYLHCYHKNCSEVESKKIIDILTEIEIYSYPKNQIKNSNRHIILNKIKENVIKTVENQKNIEN